MAFGNTNESPRPFDDAIVKKFILATIIWGVVAFLVGLIAALQLADWRFNFGLQWLTFGRLRPLHTNAAIFAFAGNAVFGGIYYSMQRLLKTRMFSDALSKAHFWGWQLIIVSAALTLPFGITVGKEYAELEWPIDIAIAVVWVVFAVNFFGTIVKRRERHIYVAIWFYIATVLTVAVLHIVNSINLPVSLFKSYPIYAGVQDALVQWWYGHNAVAFFLTTPFLGLMYYFLPKAADRPVYSYRLSILHFWTLVFMYIWAGPHHLLYTALPDWAQTLGMVFSVMLIAPSWGGMINGLLTMKGAWDRLRSDPLLKFWAAALTFYGMATFEGPMLSVKSINAVTHYGDWIIAHVHGGALGWNGFVSFAMIYWIVPRLWKTKLHSESMANSHFWISFTGILLYMGSMYASGITQGLMWRALDPSGKLVYPDFVQTVTAIVPLYWVRALGGTLFLVGALMMVYNVIKTIQGAPKAVAEDMPTASTNPDHAGPQKPHRMLEGTPAVFAVLVVLAILVGTAIELVPSFLAQDYVSTKPSAGNLAVATKPYTALELQGRDIYVREGCYVCHSQMIRPIVPETLRYGAKSEASDSMYDHPFQWGSKRTGPDLARVGGKYPDLWHFRHMLDPREIVPGSIMPTYAWLIRQTIPFGGLSRKLAVMKTLGVPYSDNDVANAAEMARFQASQIAANLEANGAPSGLADKEIVAMIAYLQRLGKPGGSQVAAEGGR